MSSKLRRATIANRLLNSGEASIAELAQIFGTSEMTIRRDLELLEIEGLARRIRGGAISTQSRSYQPPILQRSVHEALAKQKIGEAAAELLSPGETTIIDGARRHCRWRGPSIQELRSPSSLTHCSLQLSLIRNLRSAPW